MWPRTKKAEKIDRKRKRELEASITVERISQYLAAENNNTEILEFGSGEGFQIPYLKTLGRVTASDIYLADEMKDMIEESVKFVRCSILKTPFDAGHFDLIYSNHVLEHIEDLKAAFSELKRIGASDCIYAFCVPTNIWLLLSIPAQFYNKARIFFGKASSLNKARDKTPKDINFWGYILPRGHGFYKNFFQCHSFFKINSWRRLFEDNGFSILEVSPLLLYGPSEWPIVPTTRFLTKYGISSTVLFIIKKGLSKEDG